MAGDWVTYSTQCTGQSWISTLCKIELKVKTMQQCLKIIFESLIFETLWAKWAKIIEFLRQKIKVFFSFCQFWRKKFKYRMTQQILLKMPENWVRKIVWKWSKIANQDFWILFIKAKWDIFWHISNTLCFRLLLHFELVRVTHNRKK